MEQARPIQIISPVNHQFQLQPENFKDIFEANDIKDRNVVIISIAGAFRKGKSFLLNFFLKYLYAQYKKHDVTDWIGENSNGSEISGFKSRGGRSPETTGIWMWSEVFTHDYENGEKVAIILLDTQGSFDYQSSAKDYTVTFAISMMMASLQCYNVMQNVQENDLQNLELFIEYGRLALQQTNQTPFQNLLFIIRDWQYEFETPYGNAPTIVADLLAEKEIQTPEMHQLRRRIKSSFEQIGAFLMPHPGFAVAQASQPTTVGLQQIDSKFIKSLKELMPLILAPEKLEVKKIGGQKVRARDLTNYLKTYLNIFNGGGLPEPQSILMATAGTSNLILYSKCVNRYILSMQKLFEEKSLNESEPYFSPSELQSAHESEKREILSMFQKTPKLGVDELIERVERRIEEDIDSKYMIFKKQNITEKSDFEDKAVTNINKLYIDCLESYVDGMQKAISEVDKFVEETELQLMHNKARDESLSMFENHRKFCNTDLIGSVKSKLTDSIEIKYLYFKKENDKKRKFEEDLKNKTEDVVATARAEAKEAAAVKSVAETRANVKNSTLFNECLNAYKITMQKAIIGREQNYSTSEFQRIHKAAKQNSLDRFVEKQDSFGTELMLVSHLENDIDANYIIFKSQNDAKERAKMVAAHEKEMERINQALQIELKAAKEKEPDESAGGRILKRVANTIAMTILTFFLYRAFPIPSLV